MAGQVVAMQVQLQELLAATLGRQPGEPAPAVVENESEISKLNKIASGLFAAEECRVKGFLGGLPNDIQQYSNTYQFETDGSPVRKRKKRTPALLRPPLPPDPDRETFL
ncbi:hypothetical protein KSP39_PZI002161 [Platanthera zijinensis]|uniref:Uncharacterized protein n=1 Tax=Platanthera zijinensis TaxID=2320716 RepID=A0AAP0BYV2_9ASPA